MEGFISDNIKMMPKQGQAFTLQRNKYFKVFMKKIQK